MGMAQYSKDFKGAGYVLVDSLFVSEYLEQCDEIALKVYIYGLYALQSGSEGINTPERLIQELKIDLKQLIGAYTFLDDLGLVDMISENPLTVKYIPLSGAVGKPRKVKPGKYAEFTKQVQLLLPDRMITTNEFNEYFNLIEVYAIEPEALIMAIRYCTMIKSNNVNYRYIVTVAKSWIERGITTLAAAEAELHSYNKQSGEIKDVLRAMGLRGSADYSDTALYTKWREQLGFTVDAILYTARLLKTKKGNMQKLDTMLTEFFKFKKFSIKEIEDFAAQGQKYRDITYAVLKELGLYLPVVDPAIENYILPWTDKGYNETTLIQVAGYCFKVGVKTLEGMDRFIQKMHKLGMITLDSINQYIDMQYQTEQTIQDILEACGLDRQVNYYDRSNYTLWSKTWGITDTLIMHAAHVCREYFNPLKNLHSLLSYYKNNNISTMDEAKSVNHSSVLNGGYKPAAAADAGKKSDFIKHEYTKEQLSAMFTSVDDYEV